MTVHLLFDSNDGSDPGVTSPPTPATWWRILKIVSSDCMGYVTSPVATKAAPNGWSVTLPGAFATADHGTTQNATVTNPTSGDINYDYILEAWVEIDGEYGGSTFDKWTNTAEPFTVLVVDSVKAGPSTRPGSGQMWPRGVR